MLIISTVIAILLLVGFLWIAGALLGRLGVGRRERSASEERALAESQHYSNMDHMF